MVGLVFGGRDAAHGFDAPRRGALSGGAADRGLEWGSLQIPGATAREVRVGAPALEGTAVNRRL